MSNLKGFVLLLVGVLGCSSVVMAAEDKIAILDVQQAMFASDYAQSRVKQSIESADFVALKAKAEGSAACLLYTSDAADE